MSTKYPGGIITKNYTAPTPSSASGIWTLEQQEQAQQAGIWPFGGPFNYIEDVFSNYVYIGNSAARSISNGIDLSTNGGLVWIKSRPSTTDAQFLVDTARGVTKYLSSNTTAAQITNAQTVTAFNADGFSLGTDGGVNQGSTTSYASWTFRKKAKFFDVVTYTGDGVAGRTIAHNLGSVPGCMIVKASSGAGTWYVYHIGNSSPAQQYLELNTVNTIGTATSVWNDTAPTSSVFTVGTTPTNTNGTSYVAYLFAHNAGGFGTTNTDNVISCGSYTTDASAVGPEVNLGFEPQWLLIKSATVGSSNWNIVDNVRGFLAPGTPASQALRPNTTGAESGQSVVVTSTGFKDTGGLVASGRVIYIAIRRPMKVPTDATKVYLPSTSSYAAAATVTVGFPPDLSILANRGGSSDKIFEDSVRGYQKTTSTGYPSLASNSYNAEDTTVSILYNKTSTSIQVPTFWSGGTPGLGMLNLRRAAGFFDIVCYTGNGAGGVTVTHNLKAVPELIFVKWRNGVGDWAVYSQTLGAAKFLTLNSTSGERSGTTRFGTTPTSSVFYVGSNAEVNFDASSTYVAYLFATCAGVSKVGSYTGNATLTTINCGFTGGARFVLIKRTDTTSDWYWFDTARGMTAGTDPSLPLNATTAETNANSVYTITTGFQLLASPSADVNTNGGTYIYLAIA